MPVAAVDMDLCFRDAASGLAEQSEMGGWKDRRYAQATARRVTAACGHKLPRVH